MRNFEEYTEWLFNQTPLFQNIGSGAYKEGLENTLFLDEHFNHPHKNFKTIHIAGTNGKGSCSHSIASVLQEAGYNVGLYTSPHLLSFRERIRVNGKMIEEDYVMDFIDKNKTMIENLHCSFFEISTALAFLYFADKNVDVAVIEVGLGGRLDCTNIISPILSIITNISLDHVQLLGNTRAKIAAEKAGIIKKDTVCVIGESDDEILPVFQNKAKSVNAQLVFPEICPNVKALQNFELKGLYQEKNIKTILTAIEELKKRGIKIEQQHIDFGLANVTKNTGLRGRWEKVFENPTVVCDTGHNIGGFAYLSQQLKKQNCKNLRMVFGMVNDKDINGVLAMLPQNAIYYFCQASVKRALPAVEMKKKANMFNLCGNSYESVEEAFKAAKMDSCPEDFIFVGGSTFVVADFLRFL